MTGRARRPLGLRARLILTFALVAALVALAVAGISFTVVRSLTLRNAVDVAARQTRVHLDDAAATVSGSSSSEQLRQFLAQLRTRTRADVVAVSTAGAQTTTNALDATSIPTELRASVDTGRVASQRTVVGGEESVVVGGAVQPDGPAFYFFYPQQDVSDDLVLLARVLAVTSGALMIVSAGIGAAAASGVLRPIRGTRAAVRRVAAGELDVQLPAQGNDDLAELALAFNSMTAALRRTVGDLRELEAGQRRFVSDVSHELRTPLTALTTACDVLDANKDGLTDAGRRAARLVVTNSRRLAALVEDLMEISRMDAGAADVTLERVDVVRSLDGALRSRGWDGQVDVDADGRPTTLIDARRLDAIIGNLVGNARTYGRPPVTIVVRTTAEALEIDVTDAGDGIPSQHLRRIFDRFYKADRSRSSGGTGLGLAIARENARLHGGDITVRSESGHGATFTVRLPRRRAP